MKPVNILHIISKLPVGGVENQLFIVLKNYDRKRFNPIVCSLSEEGEIGREIRESGLEVISLNRLKHTFDYKIVKDICDIVKRREIKIVRTHQYHANLYGRLAAILAKVPCIVASVHNIYTMDKKLHRRVLNNLLGRFTDKVVAVSETVKKDILQYDGLPEGKVAVIYNGIDTGRFVRIEGNPVRKEFCIAQDVPVIGTIGRLTFQKGQRYLIEAAARIIRKFPRIKLLITGEGPDKNELEELAGKLGISGNVFFLGMRRDIPEVLEAIDIFVFPSLWEGLGTAFIEAMAAGRPVIATDIPPVREVLEDKITGVIVPLNNSDAIADSIELLLTNKTLAENLGKAARERAVSFFSIGATVTKYTALFETVLERKGLTIK